MAYENMTYENIMARMMKRVTDSYPNLDDREGSIIFNALASAAMEFVIAYDELNTTRQDSFVATASREWLIEACKQMGMDVAAFDATKARFLGEFDVFVSLDSRWNCGDYNFVVIEQTEFVNDHYAYILECEEAGSASNTTLGTLTPISEFPTGMTYAEITKCLVEGEDETYEDDIRDQYYNFLNSSSEDGNKAQYIVWCDQFGGIGNSKIFSLWNGANTVKVSILDSSNGVASDELIEEFQNYLDPGSTGMGDGVAPIGAIVTVSTATEKTISASATVKMKDGYTDTSVINDAISTYFAEIAYEKTSVPYMSLGAVILATEGVDSISDLKVNDDIADIPLGDEEIPVLGTTTWTVSA